jgi:CDP-glycerol glycerophosphotransferase
MSNLISVVVPAYGVQSYLDECLDSVLAPPADDVDVVVVEDASPDHTGEILDARAAREPRVSAVHLDDNVGPGPARNAGLARATGEYVWFVDGDDRLAPGAVRAVTERLREDRPDVLLVGSARERWNGKTSRDPAVLASVPGEGPVKPETALSAKIPPIGGILVRREFLTGHGLAFAPGLYEDLSFVLSVLLAARSVGTLDRVCYVSRADRMRALRTTASPRHADLVDQYDRVLALPAVAGSPKLTAQLLRRAVNHVLRVAGDPRRIPERHRRDAFHKLSELVRRHQPAAPRPGGMEGLKRGLLERDAYTGFETLRKARGVASKGVGAVRKVRAAPRRAQERLQKPALQRYYRAQQRKPLDENLAVYAAYWYRGYACNPAAIYEKARELAPHIHGVWVVNPGREKSMPEGVDHVVAGTREYYRLMARAKWLVNNVTLPGEIVKRPGMVHVQTHHGTPLKVMGLDLPRYPASMRNFNYSRLMANLRKWDFAITSNRHSTLMWDRQFPTPGETLEVGYPRNDRLANATEADVAAARAELGLAPTERVVLYTPTHRDYHPTFTPMLDVDEFAEAVGPDTRVLLRAHYFYDALQAPPAHPRVLDVSQHPTVETLYLASDVLITDYSSAMFDYAVLDRPVVIFAPDWNVYTAVRGVSFDLKAEPPGVFAESFGDLVEAFRSGEVAGERAAKERQRFRERFCALDDGRAAERVVRRVFLGESAASAALTRPV